MQDSQRSFDQDPFYSPSELQEYRRDAIRGARAMRPGCERNQLRQIAMSLKALSQIGDWLKIHDGETSLTS
jgi:hypothetical protein